MFRVRGLLFGARAHRVQEAEGMVSLPNNKSGFSTFPATGHCAQCPRQLWSPAPVESAHPGTRPRRASVATWNPKD